MSEVLYRTNTYTDYKDWYATPWDAFGRLPEGDLHGALNSIWNMLNGVGADTTGLVARTIMFDTPDREQFFNSSQQEKIDFFKMVFNDYNHFAEVPINYAVWFSSKNIVISRTNGYGKNLCKENGGVYRCYNEGERLYQRGFDVLCGYNELPKLQPDPLVNNKLISKAELEELLLYEDQAGRVLAPTCLKKDVLNVLKAARNGLIGDMIPDYERREQAFERARDRILDNIL